MWNYRCYLCDTNTNDYLCEDCKSIKKIVELYGIKSVRETVEFVYLREKEPIKNRTEAKHSEVVAKKIQTRSQTTQTTQTKEEKKSDCLNH